LDELKNNGGSDHAMEKQRKFFLAWGGINGDSLPIRAELSLERMMIIPVAIDRGIGGGAPSRVRGGAPVTCAVAGQRRCAGDLRCAVAGQRRHADLRAVGERRSDAPSVAPPGCPAARSRAERGK
jgi:hypothetical protein